MLDDARLDRSLTTSTAARRRSRVSTSFDPVLRAIRAAVSTEAPGQAGADVLPQPAPAGETAPRRQKPAPDLRHPKEPAAPAQSIRETALEFLKRPGTPRLLSVLVLLVLVLLRPGFVLFLFVMVLLTALVLYFSIGPDRVQGFAAGRYRRLRERDPDAAESLRQRAAKASKFLSAIVDRLPERWTDGLYLPDFDPPPELPEKMKVDPFVRLAESRRAEAASIHQRGSFRIT